MFVPSFALTSKKFIPCSSANFYIIIIRYTMHDCFYYNYVQALYFCFQVVVIIFLLQITLVTKQSELNVLWSIFLNLTYPLVKVIKGGLSGVSSSLSIILTVCNDSLDEIAFCTCTAGVTLASSPGLLIGGRGGRGKFGFGFAWGRG
jgi:hypothetical protein